MRIKTQSTLYIPLRSYFLGKQNLIRFYLILLFLQQICLFIFNKPYSRPKILSFDIKHWTRNYCTLERAEFCSWENNFNCRLQTITLFWSFIRRRKYVLPVSRVPLETVSCPSFKCSYYMLVLHHHSKISMPLTEINRQSPRNI